MIDNKWFICAYYYQKKGLELLMIKAFKVNSNLLYFPQIHLFKKYVFEEVF
jgi:hypothetical protein